MFITGPVYMTSFSKIALVLTGGGARGAYQAGFLRGLADILPNRNLPFGIVTGCSVGAINAAYLACFAHDFKQATARLWDMWATIKPEGVFIPKRGSFVKIALNALSHILLNKNTPLNITLLDSKPLEELLLKELKFDDIRASVSAGELHAVAFTAMDYNRRISTSFFEAKENVEGWRLQGSLGVRTTLSVEHVVGSAGLPLLFEPVKIKDSYFGDGSIKLLAPLRPAVRLGAEKIFILSTYSLGRNIDQDDEKLLEHYPSFNSIIATMLQSVFSDALDEDLARLKQLNELKTNKRHIPALEIKPSTDLSLQVANSYQSLPKSFSKFLSLIGGMEKDHTFLSYLLFEPSFTTKLLDIGYNDACAKKNEIEAFIAN